MTANELYNLLISLCGFFIIFRLIYFMATKSALSFLDSTKTRKILLALFCVVLVILVVSDFYVEKHHSLHIQAVPLFDTLCGFASCVVMVFVAKVLRFFVKRDEDYYN